MIASQTAAAHRRGCCCLLFLDEHGNRRLTCHACCPTHAPREEAAK